MGKAYEGIIGLVVGDAVGVPFEFRKRDTFSADDMTGYGTYLQPIGTWSDDSSMTIATVESLAHRGKIDLEDIMQNFDNWYSHGFFTPYGRVFDVGGTTRMAIERFKQGAQPEACGGTSIMDNGNGSLMRILPLAFVPHTVEDVAKVSALTHAHDISQRACLLYLGIAEALIEGHSKDDIKKALIMANLKKPFERLRHIDELSRDKIKSSGYVVDTLEAALWCFLTTKSYRDCVLTAVNLGEDTDTIAAVAGGLAGIYYGIGGENGVPREWIRQLANLPSIKLPCEDFEHTFKINQRGV